MRHLRRAPHRQHAARRIELGERATRLERHAGVPAHRHLELDHRVRGGECGREIAVALLDERRFRRLERRDDRRQVVDLDTHELRRILGAVGVVGEYHGDRLADVAHFVFREHRLLVRLQAADARQANADRRQMAHIFVGPDRVHGRMGAPLALVDGDDFSAGDGTVWFFFAST